MKTWIHWTLALSVFFSCISLPGRGFGGDLDISDKVQQARAYREAGDLKAAVIELKNILIKHPDAAAARFLLGEIYLQTGQGAKAEKELRRGRETGISADKIELPLAEALLQQSKYAEVLAKVEVTEQRPKALQAEVLALRGDAYLGLRDRDQARAAFAAAQEIEPNNIRSLLGLARMLKTEDAARARSLIELALNLDPASSATWELSGDIAQADQRWRDAEQAFSRAIEHKPTQQSLWLKRALVRIEDGDYAAAEEDIQTLKRNRWDRPGVHYAEGLLQLRRERYTEARAALEKMLAQQPGSLPGMFYLGLSYYALGELEQAEAYLSRVQRSAPEQADAGRLLGLVRYRLGDYAGAEAVLSPLLEHRPDDVLMLRVLGDSLVAQGRAEAGNRYLARAVELQPGAADARMDLAVALLRMGKRDQAIEELEQAARLDPELRQAELLIIREQLKARELDQVIATAERLQSKHPDSATPLVLMGMAYAGKGDIGRARQLFNQALDLQPGHPSAAHNLAVLALQAGAVDAARDFYLKALEHYPGEPRILLKLAALEARQGDKEAYRARLEEAMAKNPDALEPQIRLARLQIRAAKPLQALATLGEVAAQYRQRPAYLAALGEAQLAAGEASSAVRSLEQLVALRPESARTRYLLASAYTRTQDKEGLRRQLIAGLELQPEHPLSAYLIGQLMASAADATEADALLSQLKAVAPAHPRIIALEAQQAMRTARYGDALAIYESARQRFPDDPQWAFGLSRAQWQSGDREGSVRTLEQWRERHPQDASVYLALGRGYAQLQRAAAAKQAFTQATVLAPDNPEILNNVAWLLRVAEPNKARRLAEKAFKLAPNAAIKDTLGVILLQQGERARALELLTQAAQEGPTIPAIQYHYAMALAQSGRPVRARQTLEAIIDEQFAEREQALALLKSLGG